MRRENATSEELLLTIQGLEEKIDESTHHLQTLSEISLDWFWKTDTELRFTEVGERYFEITGVQIKNVLGKTRVELVSLIEQSKHPELWQQHKQDLAHRRPFRNSEYAIKGAHGLTRYGRIYGKPLFATVGQLAEASHMG